MHLGGDTHAHNGFVLTATTARHHPLSDLCHHHHHRHHRHHQQKEQKDRQRVSAFLSITQLFARNMTFGRIFPTHYVHPKFIW